MLLRSLNGPCGTCVDDRPSIRSFGHKYELSLGFDGCSPIGRWLTNCAASKNAVCNSLNFITCSPTIALSALY